MKSLEHYIKIFNKEDIIFNQGDTGKEMYIVKSGKVRIEINTNNEKKVIGYIEEGDFFGEMAIIDNSPRTATAIAECATELITCNKNRFYRLIETSPEFAIKIVRRLSSRLREANDRFKNLASSSKVGLFLTILSYLSSKIKEEITRESINSHLHKDGILYSEDEINNMINFFISSMIIEEKDETIKVVSDFKTLEIIKSVVKFLSS